MFAVTETRPRVSVTWILRTCTFTIEAHFYNVTCYIELKWIILAGHFCSLHPVGTVVFCALRSEELQSEPKQKKGN